MSIALIEQVTTALAPFSAACWERRSRPATACRAWARDLIVLSTNALIELAAGATGSPQIGLTAPQVLTIPNFDVDSPACIVKLPATQTQCTAEGCELTLPKGSTLESLQLNFSCLPKSAPTGFENPAPEAEVQSVHSKDANGHVSLIDDVQSTPAERLRELNFCLYGKLNNFCGNAKVLRLKDGTKADCGGIVKAFIQEVELGNGTSK